MLSSKPSRRIVSIRTPSWSSPRPATSNESLSALSVSRIDTLPSASRSSRSRIIRLVTFDPSRPAIGESLTLKVIARVGGSIFWAWSGSVTDGSTIELETVALVRPARSEEHTSELQSLAYLVCRLLLEKKKLTHNG